MAGGRNKKKHRTAPKSENVYLKLLVKVRRGKTTAADSGEYRSRAGLASGGAPGSR